MKCPTCQTPMTDLLAAFRPDELLTCPQCGTTQCGGRTYVPAQVKSHQLLVEIALDTEWLVSELQMFKNRPEFTRTLKRIGQAKAALTIGV